MYSQNLPAFLPKDILLESFTYPFFDLNFDVNPTSLVELFHRRHDATARKGARGLYVHIPFCETLCTFCPFVKSVGTSERIAAYLEALETEIDLLSGTNLSRSWVLDAIYIGGGSPSVLSPRQIERLITKLRRSWTLSPDAEITVEVEPKSATEEFCSAAASAGASRISFGVQTLDPDLRRMMNLTASLDQIHEVARLSRKMFKVANFDMIVGYPGQSDASVEEDMRAALQLEVGNISIFPLDYLATMPSFLDRIRRKELPPPPPSARRWEMFHNGRAALRKAYEPQNMYFFSEPGMPGCKYMFEIVYGGYFDEFVGLGASAYSMIRGLSYYNTQSESEYVRSLTERKSLPISKASPGHAYEKSYVYLGKRTKANIREARELGIDATVEPKLNALVDAGLATQLGDVYKLTASGERVYAQIMVGFLSDGQRRLYDRVCNRLKSGLNWNFDGAEGDEIATARGAAVRNTMP